MEQGYEILARNAVFPGAEIDLIARDGRVIVFVEVKMRTERRSYGREAVTPAKQKRICRGALRYMTEKRSDGAGRRALTSSKFRGAG